MKIKRLCQRENFVDLHNELFTPQSLKKNDGKQIPININFDMTKIVGIGKIKYHKNKGLYVEVEIDDITKIKGLKFALSGRINKKIKNKDNYVIEDCDVYSIGCVEEHADSSIKAI